MEYRWSTLKCILRAPSYTCVRLVRSLCYGGSRTRSPPTDCLSGFPLFPGSRMMLIDGTVILIDAKKAFGDARCKGTSQQANGKLQFSHVPIPNPFHLPHLDPNDG